MSNQTITYIAAVRLIIEQDKYELKEVLEDLVAIPVPKETEDSNVKAFLGYMRELERDYNTYEVYDYLYFPGWNDEEEKKNKFESDKTVKEILMTIKKYMNSINIA